MRNDINFCYFQARQEQLRSLEQHRRQLLEVQQQQQRQPSGRQQQSRWVFRSRVDDGIFRMRKINGKPLQDGRKHTRMGYCINGFWQLACICPVSWSIAKEVPSNSIYHVLHWIQRSPKIPSCFYQLELQGDTLWSVLWSLNYNISVDPDNWQL